MRRHWDGSPVNPNVKKRKPPVRRPLPERIERDRDILDPVITNPKIFETMMRYMWGPTT
jgi:hypothetical protein